MVLERLVELRDDLAAGPAPEKRRTKVVDFAARRAELEKRRERLLQTFEDGLSTRERVRERMALLDAERLRKAWRRAPADVRRQIVNQLAEAFMLENGASPAPRWRPVEELLAGIEPR